MPSVVFYIGGDSYPADHRVEDVLRTALTEQGLEFVGHREIFKDVEAENGRPSPSKLDILEAAVKAHPSRDEVFTFGRSAGARLATRLADRCAITAIACLCYPFRAPKRVLDAGRFSHLATLKTPTLILQGESDPYGGLEVTESYRLSPSIRLRFFTGVHNTNFDSPAGPNMLREILRFFGGGWRDSSANLLGFDEAFYRETYPDVTRAIEEGAFESGEQHFLRRGRQEHRKFRLPVHITAGTPLIRP